MSSSGASIVALLSAPRKLYVRESSERCWLKQRTRNRNSQLSPWSRYPPRVYGCLYGLSQTIGGLFFFGGSSESKIPLESDALLSKPSLFPHSSLRQDGLQVPNPAATYWSKYLDVGRRARMCAGGKRQGETRRRLIAASPRSCRQSLRGSNRRTVRTRRPQRPEYCAFAGSKSRKQSSQQSCRIGQLKLQRE